MALPLIIFLLLAPFGAFFYPSLVVKDLWYASGQFTQVGILFLFAWSFFDKSKEIKVKNLPLALLTLYLGLMTSYGWYLGIMAGTLNWLVFQPFFNFLCFLIFYKLCFQLDREIIYKFLTWFSYSLAFYLILCTLQFFELGQFFKVVAYVDGKALHRVVGLLGNESQNAIYLGMILPVFYLVRNRFSMLCACLIWVLLAITDSASGVMIATTVTVFFSIFHRLPIWYYLYIILGAVGFIIGKSVYCPELSLYSLVTNYVNPHGRLDIWERLLPLIKETSILGRGMGVMNLLAKGKDFKEWRHVHNEYYQLWLTGGFIGMSAVLYCVWEYFRGMFKDRLSVVLVSMFLGFCVACLIYFPAHLWMTAIIGMFSYSFMYVLKNEELE